MTAKRTPVVAEAFRQLQAGNAARALEIAREAVRAGPQARAFLAEGIALRMLGRHDEALAALDRAARLDPRDHATAYESGVVHQLKGESDAALAKFEECRSLKPGFFAAHFSSGSMRLDRGDWEGAIERFRAALALEPRQVEALRHLARALQRAGRHAEAENAFVHALAANPHDVNVLRAFGQFSAGRGNFRRAATLYAEAARALPDDEVLPIHVAHAELLQGRWTQAWSAYSRRATRRQVEKTLAAQGAAYSVPALESLAGRDVQLIAEQGYGDILFFLRWAPIVERAGARLRFVGPRELHSLLERTRLFSALHDFKARDTPAAVPVLVGDLPMAARSVDPTTVASLRIPPLPDRVEHWKTALARAGPRPWIGLTWRAGKPLADGGLHKAVPLESFMEAVAPLAGTAVALQRAPGSGEIEAAARALGRPLADFSRMNDDLEDALALVSLLDRHVGVSNTNMHLAAAAGATADVLVPFPPEWRWRTEGDSPWFPGFRVHRQPVDGDWTAALAGIAR